MLDSITINQRAGRRRQLNTGMGKYSGPWTDEHRLHLLRRCLFGVNQEHKNMLREMSMDEMVDMLLIPAPDPSVPVNDYNSDDLVDPEIPFGEPWVESKNRDIAAITSARIISLKSWMVKNFMDQSVSLHEKMIFFWHNHLATQSWEVFWPHLTYNHIKILRKHAFGNFKDLVREITLDPHMLIYLNGALNRNSAPDENYARELQELFCVGKGDEAAFTESDVQEAARVLTGHSIDWEDGGSYLYRPYWHDEGDKQFSAFYGNRVIKGGSGDQGAAELDELLDMIFSNAEVSRFLVRKLYRFFVYSEIDDVTESMVIEPLAQEFIDNDYEIEPVLRRLFTSEHFFDQANMGAMIKTPLDFLVGFWKSTGVKMPEGATVSNEFEIRTSMLWTMSNQGLEVLDPPNVSGFPAYHQFPQYDKSWITTNTITNRASVTDAFVYWGFWSENLLTTVDLLDHINSFASAEDPIKLVDDLVLYHLAYPVSEDVKNRMLLILLSGQISPHYWTDAWIDYSKDPTNQMKRNTVEIRAKVLFQFLFQLAEFQLS